MTTGNIKGRDGKGRAIRTTEQIRRDIEAADLRSSMTLGMLGAKFGVSRQAVVEMVRRGRAAIPTENDIEAKQNAIERAEERVARLTELAKHPRPKVDHGHIVKDEQGVDVPDVAAQLQAEAVLIRAEAELRALTGTTGMTEADKIKLDLDKRQVELNEQYGQKMADVWQAILGDPVVIAALAPAQIETVREASSRHLTLVPPAA